MRVWYARAGQCLWVSPERQRVAKRCPSRGGERRASACKRDDANQMARTIMSKDCNRGQSAMWRRVGNRSSIWRSIHRNQCETEPRGEGERNRCNQSHTESCMRENCMYGSMRGIRRKTAKHVLRVAEGRAGVPDNTGRPALLY